VINQNPVNQDKALELWNIAKGQKIETSSSNPHSTGPDVLAISSDSTLLARDDGGTLVQIYRLSDGKLVRSFNIASSEDFEHAIWSPDGKYIAEGKDGVTIYDVSTGKAVTTVGRTDATHQILHIVWSPDSKELATMTGPSKPTDPSASTFNVWKLQ
jgi:WD40 repeat protein